MKIINPLGIVSSEVPTGNLLWVDQVNGVDALATRGRMTIPFKTLTKAKEAAQSGDTIMVLPGTYNETNLLRNGVNLHFFAGAVLDCNTASSDAVFDDNNTAMDCAITGDGCFRTPSGRYLVRTRHASSVIRFECSELLPHSGNSCQGWWCQAGSQQIMVKSQANAGSANLLLSWGGAQYASIAGTVCGKLHCAGGIQSTQAAELAASSVLCEAGEQRITTPNINSTEITADGGFQAVEAGTILGSNIFGNDGEQHIAAREALSVKVQVSDANQYYAVPLTTGRSGEYVIEVFDGIHRHLGGVVIADDSDVCNPGFGIYVANGAVLVLKDVMVMDYLNNCAVTGQSGGVVKGFGVFTSRQDVDPVLTSQIYLSHINANLEF